MTTPPKAVPGARGTGVDIYGPDIVRGRAAAVERGLSDRAGYGADVEEWLLDHPDHPEAAGLRAKLDEHLAIWLRGLRDVFGFCYVTLGVPA